MRTAVGLTPLEMTLLAFEFTMEFVMPTFSKIVRFAFLGLASTALVAAVPSVASARPNVVVVFCDDLGYGDLGCYGHPTIRTPNLDRMAAEGTRFTQFYSANPVCTPSRYSLLTGKLSIRGGMTSKKNRVLRENSKGGLPADELTIAELLKQSGYRTMCVGKWHLGVQPEHLPMRHGFDHWFGLPYSNDMPKQLMRINTDGSTVSLGSNPMFRDDEVIEHDPDQRLLTERYTDEALKFITAAADAREPFFLYLPHSMPHTPIHASRRFAGKSPRGLYGDVIEALDWSTGEILDTLRKRGLAENTLVVFTSDNGPWLIRHENGGSAGLLREGKGSTWEGGQRVPGIFWMPGTVKAGAVTTELGSTLDLLPTIAGLVGARLPDTAAADGYDLGPLLREGGKSPRKEMFFYRDDELFAVRLGAYKAHFKTQPAYFEPKATAHEPPLLYNLDVDPSEKYDVGKDHADVVAKIAALAENHRASVVPVKNQLEELIPIPAGETK